MKVEDILCQIPTIREHICNTRDLASDAAAQTASSATPIDEILSSRDDATADVTARPTPEGDGERSRIPIAAIRRERERREKYDREVQRLEAEISKYNDQKWGFTAEEPAEQQGSEGPTFDPAAMQALDRSMGGFAARHGQNRLTALESAVTRLTPAQQDEARAYAAGKPQRAPKGNAMYTAKTRPEAVSLCCADN